MILIVSFDCGIRKECILRFQVNTGITGPFHVLRFTPIMLPVIHKAKDKAHSCLLSLIQDEIESLRVKQNLDQHLKEKMETKKTMNYSCQIHE